MCFSRKKSKYLVAKSYHDKRAKYIYVNKDPKYSRPYLYPAKKINTFLAVETRGWTFLSFNLTATSRRWPSLGPENEGFRRRQRNIWPVLVLQHQGEGEAGHHPRQQLRYPSINHSLQPSSINNLLSPPSIIPRLQETSINHCFLHHPSIIHFLRHQSLC